MPPKRPLSSVGNQERVRARSKSKVTFDLNARVQVIVVGESTALCQDRLFLDLPPIFNVSALTECTLATFQNVKLAVDNNSKPTCIVLALNSHSERSSKLTKWLRHKVFPGSCLLVLGRAVVHTLDMPEVHKHLHDLGVHTSVSKANLNSVQLANHILALVATEEWRQGQLDKHRTSELPLNNNSIGSTIEDARLERMFSSANRSLKALSDKLHAQTETIGPCTLMSECSKVCRDLVQGIVGHCNQMQSPHSSVPQQTAGAASLPLPDNLEHGLLVDPISDLFRSPHTPHARHLDCGHNGHGLCDVLVFCRE